MKRQDFNFSWSVVRAIIAATLCAYCARAAEMEPNNTRAQANVMVFNTSGQATITGRVNPLSDLDFFSVTTPAFSGQGTLVITMTPTSADRGLDARMQLQSANGTLLVDRDVGFDNAVETISYNPNANTTYFIACRSADFSDAGSGDYTLQIGLLLPAPNLVPYQPTGWSDKIVVSKSAGTTNDSSGLTATNVLYLDWAVLNSGNLVVGNPFSTALYLDGLFKTNWTSSNVPLNAGFFIKVQDYAIGPLAIGSHTIKIVTDATGAIAESNEGDNEFTKTINVADDDLNDQLSGALVLGALNHTFTMPGGIDAPTDVDMFSFTVINGQRVSFDIDQTSGLNSHIRLFDAGGVELAANDDKAGPGESGGGDSYVEYTFVSGGTYYVGISGSGNTSYNAIAGTGDMSGSSGSYTLVVSPGLAGTIRRPADATDYPVDILGFGANPPAINTNQRTWIVIHGWNSSRANGNISAIANALFETRSGDQVLTLDWSAAANTGNLNPFAAEDGIVPVAQWAAAALVGHGFIGTNLNLVGHSFGSYVADEIAQRVPGGVNTIVTLDPAANVLGGYDSDSNAEVDFAAHSFFSWSFHSSSIAGNEYTPTTADESFVVESGADPITAHGNVVFLFAYMLLHPDDLVSHFFLITDLLQGKSGPWLPDRYFSLDGTTPGYEAKITTANEGLTPASLEFVRFPSLSIAKSGDDVVVAWPAYYTDFILQSSTLGGQSDPWANVLAQPSVVGQFNVVIRPRTEAKRFFRLIRP